MNYYLVFKHQKVTHKELRNLLLDTAIKENEIEIWIKTLIEIGAIKEI